MLPFPAVALALALAESPCGEGGAPAPPAVPFPRLYAETRGFRAGRPVRAEVAPGGREVLFLRSGPRSGVQSLFATDLATGETRLLLDAERLLAADGAGLTDAEAARLERQRITARGVTRYELSRDGRTLVAAAGGRHYAVDRERGSVRRLPLPPGAIDPRLAPDGRQLAFASGGELRVLDLEGGGERVLTTGASEWKTHGVAEFVAQEEMGRSEGYWWSPDSRAIAFEEVDDGGVEKLSIADPAHPERSPVRFAYPRAGRTNAAVRLGIVPAKGGEVAWVEWDRSRYPYLAQVRWDRSGLYALVQSRPQTEEVLLRIDPATGRTRALLVEEDRAWLNLQPAFPRALPDGASFAWFTERNGGAEVEVRRPDGSLAGSLVPPAWGFTAWAGADPASGFVYFVGSRGDPTADWLYRVKPGSAPEEVPLPLTRPAVLSATVAEGGGPIVVTSSEPAGGTRTAVFAPDGRRLADLPAEAIAPPACARPEVRRVGRLGWPAALIRPRDFRPGWRYPVIVEVYGGPTHLAPLRLRSEAPLLQWIADQGFLVVRIVNRGETMRLGRDFERAVKGNFSGPTLDDQVEALRALAAEVPEMDLGRVGVRGWSFGGYMAALSVLRRPDVYRAAVAGAPVADWLDYDTHYTERYLGLPAEDPGAYQRSSLAAWTRDAKRPLLVVHGTADDNVYFLHSLKLADALARAGRPPALVPLPGVTHLPADPDTAERLATLELAFLREHLGGPLPPGH
ncbi:MAG TPA: DPP IV N-terminal domain-containing protein [Anaeromyxobacteraceae bacterium]|nr:DPP IV N-terminal domain-containing protein [Anaeromyxobacteraceae bacterium]